MSTAHKIELRKLKSNIKGLEFALDKQEITLLERQEEVERQEGIIEQQKKAIAEATTAYENYKEKHGL